MISNIKNSSPTVSICIPTYCGEKYFKECLESVLDQTFHDFEILIVDDCSTDHTLHIANQYAKYDSRIRIIRNEKNLGLVGNWNRCVELAQGEWIKYVFQDDLLAPTCLETMIDIAKLGKDLITCRRNFIFDDTTSPALREYYTNNAQLIDNLFGGSINISPEKYSKCVLSHLGLNLVGEPTAIMVHRNVFHRFGMFNNNLAQACDHEMWTRVAIHIGITYIPEILATFRVHGTSTSARNHQTKKYRTDVLDWLILLHDMACHPIYFPLRTVASELSPPFDLNNLLRQRARSAWLQAIHNSDQSIMAEWEHTSKAYPILKFLVKRTLHELWFEQIDAKRAAIRSRLKLLKESLPTMT